MPMRERRGSQMGQTKNHSRSLRAAPTAFIRFARGAVEKDRNPIAVCGELLIFRHKSAIRPTQVVRRGRRCRSLPIRK